MGVLPVGFSLVTPVIFKEALKEELELAWTRGVQSEHDPRVAPGDSLVWEQARGVGKRGGEGEVAAGALGLGSHSEEAGFVLKA